MESNKKFQYLFLSKTDEGISLPTSDVAYGPYNSIEQAENDAIQIFSPIEQKRSDVPNGVRCLIIKSDTKFSHYTWVNEHYRLNGGSGSGDMLDIPSYNQIANWIFNVSNPRYIIPINSEGKTTKQALEKATETKITITDNKQQISIDSDTIDTFNFVLTPDPNIEIKKISTTDNTISFCLTSNSEDDFFSIQANTYFFSFQINSINYSLVISSELSSQGYAYVLNPSSNVLLIDDHNRVGEVTVDIDVFDFMANRIIQNSDLLSEDKISAYILQDGQLKELKNYYVSTSTNGQIEHTIKLNGNTKIDDETFAELATTTEGGLLKHGLQIIIKVQSDQKVDYVTIFVNCASATTGYFTSNYAFGLSRSSTIVIPSLLSTETNTDLIKLATSNYVWYYSEDNTPIPGYITECSITGATDDSYAFDYIKNESNKNIGIEFKKITDDLTVTLSVTNSDEDKQGKISYNILFSDSSTYYYFLAESPTILLNENDVPEYSSLNFAVTEVGSTTNVYTYSDNSSEISKFLISRTLSPELSVNGGNLQYEFTEDDEDKIKLHKYLEFHLYVKENSNWNYYGTTKIYVVKNGTNGINATFILLNNDTIIADDDASISTLQTISQTTASLLGNVAKYWLVELTPLTSGINLDDYFLKTIWTFTSSVSSIDINLTLKKDGIFNGKPFLGKITYQAYDNFSGDNEEFSGLYASRTQTVKIIDIGDSYKLIVSPNVIPLSSDGKLNLLTNNLDVPLIIKATSFGQSGAKSAKISNSQSSGNLFVKINGNLTSLSSNQYTSQTSNLTKSNTGLKVELYYQNGTTPVLVDSETVGFTKQGLTGSSSCSVQLSNDSVIIDDDSSDSVIQQVTECTATFYEGNVPTEVNKWEVTISDDLKDYLELNSNIVKFDTNSTTNKLLLTTGRNKIGNVISGYVTYTAIYNGVSYSKILTIKVVDISDGSSYNLLVFPNIIQLPYTGNPTGDINIQLLEISDSEKEPIYPGNPNYIFKARGIGLTDTYTIDKLTIDSFTLSGYSPNKQGVIIDVYKKFENSEILIDTETIGFAKEGQPGAASQGISYSLSNDSFIADDDIEDGGLKQLSRTKVIIYLNANGTNSQLKPGIDYSIKHSVDFYSANGQKIISIIRPVEIGNLNSIDCYYAIGLTSGSSLKNQIGYGYHTITVNPKNNTFDSFDIIQTFSILDFSLGDSYSLSINPTILVDDYYNDNNGKYNLNPIITRITSKGELINVAYDANNFYSKDNTITPVNSSGKVCINYYMDELSYDPNKTSQSGTLGTSGLSSIYKATKYIKFVLYVSVEYPKNSGSYQWRVLDTETVPVLQKGLQGIPGGVYRYRGEWNNSDTYYGGDVLVDGRYYIDVVKITTIDNNSSSRVYYQCIKENSNENPNENSNCWQKFDDYELLMTHTLLVRDDNGNVTGGFTGGIERQPGDIVIWAGAKEDNYAADKAAFRVDDQGNVYAKSFVGEGTFKSAITYINKNNFNNYCYQGFAEPEIRNWYKIDLIKCTPYIYFEQDLFDEGGPLCNYKDFIVLPFCYSACPINKSSEVITLGYIPRNPQSNIPYSKEEFIRLIGNLYTFVVDASETHSLKLITGPRTFTPVTFNAGTNMYEAGMEKDRNEIQKYVDGVTDIKTGLASLGTMSGFQNSSSTWLNMQSSEDEVIFSGTLKEIPIICKDGNGFTYNNNLVWQINVDDSKGHAYMSIRPDTVN